MRARISMGRSSKFSGSCRGIDPKYTASDFNLVIIVLYRELSRIRLDPNSHTSTDEIVHRAMLLDVVVWRRSML
jgi:hypothetical protein